MSDYYNYYETCECSSDKINCITLSSLYKCRFFSEILEEFPTFRLLYGLELRKLNNITKECVSNTDTQFKDKIYRNILFCCHLCQKLNKLQDKFIVIISMIEYILKNWNEEFRNREFLTELVEKLNVIININNYNTLESILSKMYDSPVNDSIFTINSWIYILLDEISCAIY